ncbi:hypothetical protein Verru16b_01090 [Lacunisphaera limnophila]|uniref:Uncharacterized protein n=1 Tax=Lacunisphaera limnophila TaxID=1838286 RepID=A0A1D8AT02_9BACT|nr:hypothetical protein [Lacunisphaera limnophila]AOS44029.1 hypothetical protein Verru16b_01090 [Lacunisphaera limnophila]
MPDSLQILLIAAAATAVTLLVYWTSLQLSHWLTQRRHQSRQEPDPR